jgi:hypothetical protein
MKNMLWGSQSWLQPPFKAAPSEYARGQRRLKGGGSQDWLPYGVKP